MMMRTLTWLLLFVSAFFIAVVMVLTFLQPAFRQEAGARLLTVETHAIPVYMYVLGAFLVGLVIGVFGMLPGYIRSKVEGGRKNKRIRELEQKLVESERQHLESSGDARFLPSDKEERSSWE
jgi:uncharacterized integral membrane protein